VLRHIEEDYNLSLRIIGDRPGAAITAYNLGHAYLTLPALRDLEEAEHWYRRSLELLHERDRLGRGRCHNQLGLMALERFKEARAAGHQEEELLRHLNDAARFYHQALDLLPPNALDDLVIAHGQLGNTYGRADDLNRALGHYQQAIRHAEAGANFYEAARYRFNVALALARAGRLADAREYAHAALRNYQTYGDRAAEEIERTQGLIADIERLSQAKGG
jgi:tetratricopeptide (TPR) repeat protein